MQRIRMAVRENRLVSRVIGAEDYADYLFRRGCGWVAEEAGQVVGFAIGDGEDASVWALFVDPAHEGQGHGRRLHDAMLAWFWAAGHAVVRLGTEPGTRAERFYLCAGWQPVGIRPGGEVEFEMRRPAAS